MHAIGSNFTNISEFGVFILGTPVESQQISDRNKSEIIRHELAIRGYNLDNLTFDSGYISISLSEIENAQNGAEVELQQGKPGGTVKQLYSSQGKSALTGEPIQFTFGANHEVLFSDNQILQEMNNIEGGEQGKAIPLVAAVSAIAALVNIAMQVLLLTLTVILVAGVLYLVATEAIPRIMEERKRNKKTPTHFAAYRAHGNLYIGDGLSLNEAVARGRAGGDTWSASGRTSAYGIARRVKKGKPVGPERDENKPHYYCHYHPKNRHPPMHAFYGTTAEKCPKRR